MKKQGIMSRIGRRIAPYLVAIAPLLACDKDIMGPEFSEIPQAQEEQYSPQEQEQAKQTKIWYQEASEDGVIKTEELQDLETIAEIPVENTNKKQKEINLTTLASSSERPNIDVNLDGRENIFDILEFLKKFKNEECDINSDGKTDIFDLLTILKVLSGNYDSTKISGTLLDTDTWQINPNLKGWIEILGDTTWCDNQGRFSKRIEKQDLVNLKAGYKNSNNEPASFVATIRDIDGMNNQNLDIAICTYLNLGDVSPEGFREGLKESNYQSPLADPYYQGAKALRKDMIWHISKKGRRGDTFTDEHMDKIVEVLTEVNSNLKYPLQIVVDTTDWIPVTDADKEGKIYIEREINSGGSGTISYRDDGIDGRKDYMNITLLDPSFLTNAVYEEANSALTCYGNTETPLLKYINLYSYYKTSHS